MPISHISSLINVKQTFKIKKKLMETRRRTRSDSSLATNQRVVDEEEKKC